MAPLILITLGAASTKLPEDISAKQAQTATINQLVTTDKTALATPPLDKGCVDGKEDRRSDLCAQWTAADAAKEAAIWARKSYDLAFYSTLFLLVTMILAFSSNRIALKILKVENRPWIDVEKIELEPFIRIDNDPTRVLCLGTVHLKNTGRTVATRPVVRCWIDEYSSAAFSVRK